jgi:hypothetical protein
VIQNAGADHATADDHYFRVALHKISRFNVEILR